MSITKLHNELWREILALKDEIRHRQPDWDGWLPPGYEGPYAEQLRRYVNYLDQHVAMRDALDFVNMSGDL